jgi:hypothetical protein
MNSSDEESTKEEHGDVLTGMYTAGLKASVLLFQSEVAHQRAAAEAFREVGYGVWINSDAPASSCSASDFSQSTPSSPASTRCGSRFDTPDPSEVSESEPVPAPKTQKSRSSTGKVAPPRATTPIDTSDPLPVPRKGERGGKKAAVPADSQSTHPMATRRASRAGSLRPGGGSGQTDTCVARSHPSQT